MSSGLSLDELVLVVADEVVSSAELATSGEDVNTEDDVVVSAKRRKDRRLESMPFSASSMEIDVADRADDEERWRQWRVRESRAKGGGEGANPWHDERDLRMASSSSEAKLFIVVVKVDTKSSCLSLRHMN